MYPTQAQEAFLQGHIEAFDAIGGIPTKHIKYDNLTSAVTAVIHGPGRARNENDRWVLFRSHYGFDAFYCQSGIEGAHEKGGVEGAVGWFRRNHLVPMPEVDSLDQLMPQSSPNISGRASCKAFKCRTPPVVFAPTSNAFEVNRPVGRRW